MTKAEFVQRIIGELTSSGSIPYTIPTPEIERIIDKEMRFLYREYRTLLQDKIYIITNRYYQTPEWKNTRTFQMNKCTEGIKKVVEMTGGGVER